MLSRIHSFGRTPSHLAHMQSKTAAAAAASAYTSSYASEDVPPIESAKFPELSSGTPLEQVRSLRKPTYEELLRRDPCAHHFYRHYDGLLGEAWKEWEDTSSQLPVLSDEAILHPAVVQAFAKVWEDPSKEDEVRNLWEEVAPGVFKIQFFDPSKIHILREYFHKAAESGIPCRPPYGITLNRKGFMLDERSAGHLAVPGFQKFYRELVDKYMRPSGRLLYPEYINAADDSDSFSFTIEYQPNQDEKIRQHSDASALTCNMNMNLPDEEYTGSSLYFVDPTTGEQKHASFGLGEAMVHRGATQHAALPITSGTRSNVVLWLYGQAGQFNRGMLYGPDEQLSLAERWTKPAAETRGNYAPF